MESFEEKDRLNQERNENSAYTKAMQSDVCDVSLDLLNLCPIWVEVFVIIVSSKCVSMLFCEASSLKRFY